MYIMCHMVYSICGESCNMVCILCVLYLCGSYEYCVLCVVGESCMRYVSGVGGMREYCVM